MNLKKFKFDGQLLVSKKGALELFVTVCRTVGANMNGNPDWFDRVQSYDSN